MPWIHKVKYDTSISFSPQKLSCKEVTTLMTGLIVIGGCRWEIFNVFGLGIGILGRSPLEEETGELAHILEIGVSV